MTVEIVSVTERRRAGGDTAAAEIWIAYLHLMKAKGAVRSREMVDELQALMDAALDAFRKYQTDPARPSAGGKPFGPINQNL
jgi:hypothetical protein